VPVQIPDYLKDDPEHADRPGTPKCTPHNLDERVLAILSEIPREQIIAACNKTGHTSFWLGPGYRYRCFCGEVWYND